MHNYCASYNSFIGMFYYTLGNLRPELRSTQRSIQLIACVTSPILEKYGFEAVLRPFIDIFIMSKLQANTIYNNSNIVVCTDIYYVNITSK